MASLAMLASGVNGRAKCRSNASMVCLFHSNGAGGALALATHGLHAQPANVQPADAVHPASTLERAFIYAFPIYEMMRIRWNYIEDPKNPLRWGVNEIAHGRTLIDHT